MRVCTCDSSQGGEKTYVIIDFVRSGPSFGFLTDMQRQCVAFSRASQGQIGVGSIKMGLNAMGKSVQALKSYIDYFCRSMTGKS